MKYASFVANGLYNLGYTDMIDTDFEYTRMDTQGNTIVCKALIENPVLAGAVFAETPDQIIEKTEDVLTYPVSLRIVDTAGNVISGEDAEIKWTLTGSDTENVTLTADGTSGELEIKANSGSYKITAEITYLGETITREYSFAVTVPGEGMLIDSGFESGSITADTSWKFMGGTAWHGCGTASVSSDKANSGSYSGYANSGAVGQRVTLTSGTKYSLTAKLYSDAANTTGSAIGFYDGAQTWPMSNAVQVENLTFTSDQTGKWITYTTTFTPSATKEYLVGLWAAEGTGIYIDDVVLKEYDGEDEETTPEPSEQPSEEATATPQPTEAPTPKPEKKCVKITAEYNEDGSLKSVKTEEINVSDIEETENTDTLKVMYWESLESMKSVSAEGIADPDYFFVFGDTDTEDGIVVNGEVPYGTQDNGMTYGFLAIEGAPDASDGSLDAFFYDESTPMGYLKNGSVNGHSYVTADYSKYDETTVTNMGDATMPMRFCVEAEQHKYYTVSATVVNTSETENAEVTLFSEKRHYIMLNEKLAPGERVTKTFNVMLESVYYSGSGIIDDNTINIVVAGKNAGLEKVAVKQHEELGQTIWMCTDSTGCDQGSGTPYFALRNYGGVGAALAKYINPEIAISNQGEGGLEASDWNHFNNAVEHMQSGDYLYVQYGFNDYSPEVYKSNLEKYYTAAHEKGVKLLIVSPTERRNTNYNYDYTNGKWTSTNAGYAEAGKAFVDEKIAAGADDIAFIDLQAAIIEWMNEASEDILAQRQKLGFSDTGVSPSAMDYYYLCGWEVGADTVHINDAGADNAAYLVMQQAKAVIAADPDGVQAKVLADFVKNAPDNTPYTITDEIVADGWAPNVHYPYPSADAVDYTYPTMVKDVEVSDNKLVSMTVKVQGTLGKYAQGTAEILDENGEVAATLYTVSTDINQAIGHIDNTAARYGDVVVMYFDQNDSNNVLGEGYTYKAYVLPIENGADMPDSEPKYSSVYTEQPAVLEYLITGTDGVSADMFDYGVDEGTDIAGLGANSQTGTNSWLYVGSSSYTKHETAVKDGMTAADLYNNGSGTFSLSRYFNGYKTISSGKVHMQMQMSFMLGAYNIKLTNTAKAASWMDGITVMSVNDGYVYMYDGTQAGQLKTGKWTDIDIWVDLDRGTEIISIAGDDPVTCNIDRLQTSNADDAASLLPIRGINVIYTAHPSTIVSYTFETYITDLSVTSIETDTPQINVQAYVQSGCEEMGSVSGDGEFDINSDVTLTAVPNEGYTFRGWYNGEELYSKEKTITINRVRSDVSLSALFALQKFKEDITAFDIGSDKDAVKVGAQINLYPENAVDNEGGEIEAVTASDIAWSCEDDGISISTDGVLTVSEDYEIDSNSVVSVTVKGEINGYSSEREIKVYSYAYYEEMSEKSDFDGTAVTVADRYAIAWPGASTSSVYKLSEPVTLDKDTQITYSNVWSGINTAGQNRYIIFRDSDNNEVFTMYYSWNGLLINADTAIWGAIQKDTWTDVVIDIEQSTGKVTVSSNGESIETSISTDLLTDIASIELSSAKACPGPDQRPLGISQIIISQ